MRLRRASSTCTARSCFSIVSNVFFSPAHGEQQCEEDSDQTAERGEKEPLLHRNNPDSYFLPTYHPPKQQQQEHHEFIIIKQLETRPILEEQLHAEVEGCYLGIGMLESKCKELDSTQSAGLNDEQWKALTNLHQTLLDEYYDFLQALQHPAASPRTRELASEYGIPARIWLHGIHSFLQLLQHHLPASLEHTLHFFQLAYSMMALLYETSPTFKDYWLQCLRDLSTYRMTMEDEGDEGEDREIWTEVTRYWE